MFRILVSRQSRKMDMWRQCRLKQSQNHLSMRLRQPFRNHSGNPFSANALIEEEYSVGVIPVSFLNWREKY